MATEVVQEDMGDGNAQCTNHPYKNSIPGGICVFCLQEKLGKLVSSSFNVAVFPSSSSSSPSFRSEFGGSSATSSGGAALQVAPASASNVQQIRGNRINYNMRRSKLPLVKKNKDGVTMNGSDSSSIVFRRSKSTATPRRGVNMNYSTDQDYSPHRRRFWSFLYMLKHSKAKNSSDKKLNSTPAASHSVVKSSREKKREDSYVMAGENESPNEASYERKVSRSRSVGCGSRSFSGDLFERISNGFGDCTLRRVESHREGKTKVQQQKDCIKERVRCGGIFSGFIITSSSSSSSSYLITEDKSVSSSSAARKQICHGRSRSWGWALASPIRALAKPSTGKRAPSFNKNVVSPNLSAIPSLLADSGRA